MFWILGTVAMFFEVLDFCDNIRPVYLPNDLPNECIFCIVLLILQTIYNNSYLWYLFAVTRIKKTKVSTQTSVRAQNSCRKQLHSKSGSVMATLCTGLQPQLAHHSLYWGTCNTSSIGAVSCRFSNRVFALWKFFSFSTVKPTVTRGRWVTFRVRLI